MKNEEIGEIKAHFLHNLKKAFLYNCFSLVGYYVNGLILLLLLLSLMPLKSYAQRNIVSGVSIAADTLPPHPSAILEIRATNKGILLPRMTNDQKGRILNPADGLTVYVTDNDTDLKGLWYYNKPLNKWEHLTPKQPAYPKGAIIMYTGGMENFDGNGKGGGDKDGWQICNGNNGTPDLRGRFVAGATAVASESDYYLNKDTEEYGKNSPQPKNNEPVTSAPHNTFVMTAEHLPIHSHNISGENEEGINFRHPHAIKGGEHTHTINVMEKKNAISGFSFMGLDAAKETNTYTFSPTFARVSINSEANVIKSGQFPAGVVTASGMSASQIVPVDNRPAYYVVIYIMKTE